MGDSTVNVDLYNGEKNLKSLPSLKVDTNL